MAEGSADSEVIANLIPKSEKLTLIPNDLFEADPVAEQRRPAALGGIPYYNLDTLVNGFPLIERLGEIKEMDAIKTFAGKENVIRIRLGSIDMVLKVLGPTSPEQLESYGKLPEWEDDGLYEGFIVRQAAGMNVAHYLDPELVDAPIGVFTYRGKPAAFMIPHIEGIPQQVGGAEYVAYPVSQDEQRDWDIMAGRLKPADMTPEEDENRIKRDNYRVRIKNLRRAGIVIDDADPASNAIVTGAKVVWTETPYTDKLSGEQRMSRNYHYEDIKPGNPRGIKLIDLEVRSRHLNKPLSQWSEGLI